MDFTDLTPEQQERVRNCKTPEDILELAKEEGYELSDEELSSVSGGGIWDCFGNCPNHCSHLNRCPRVLLRGEYGGQA